MRQPVQRDITAHRPDRLQCATAHLWRLVIEQQRGDQTALIQRLQDVDGVDDASRIGLREFLDQRLDRREVRVRHAQILGFHQARLETMAEALEILAPCPYRHRDPEHRHRQARITQVLPIKVETPRLDEHDEQDCAQSFRHAIHGDIDE